MLFLCINGINDLKFDNSNIQIHEHETCDTSLTRRCSFCRDHYNKFSNYGQSSYLVQLGGELLPGQSLECCVEYIHKFLD